jgi:hypothetical protein
MTLLVLKQQMQVIVQLNVLLVHTQEETFP